MSDIAIGIDLGTSTSCVAVLRDGRVEVLRNGYGEPITASVVSLKEDGTIVVGNAAKANIIHDPAHTIYSSKRLMGRYYFSEEVKKAQAICSYKIVEGPNHGVRIQVREETFSPPELGAMILRELKCIAESRLGQSVTKAVITVPANFNDNQRQATKDAGRIAGLEVLRILNEPTAAALAYGFGRGLSQKVAVYDLGGGTFDISILEIGRDVFEVLSTCGDTFLGGDDFDDRVIDLLADEFLQKHHINLRNDPFALEKLKVAAENAKRSLSVDDEAEIRIPDVVPARGSQPALSIERRLSAGEFASLVNDLVQRTFKVCDEALQQASMVARDLDGLILVGGPTHLPLIRDTVKNYFGLEPKEGCDPEQVVAMGAAIHAATLIQAERDAFLLDVTPLSLRIGVAGGLAETVIERNTPVPIEQTRAFTTFQDDQESVKIRVYQGESREAEANELLGQFEFSGFRKAARGQVAIDVTFEINADGIVNVTARDRETGQQSSTRITLSSGLSEGEIRDIIDEGRTDRVRTNPAPDTEVLGSVSLVSRPVSVRQAREALEPAAERPARPAAPAPAPVAPAATAPAAAVPAAAAPADELEVYPDDETGEELDLLPDDEDEPVDLELADAATRPDLDSGPPSATTDAALADTQQGDLFEAVGTDLSQLPDDTGKS
jgi:molecular chaperone DnaK